MSTKTPGGEPGADRSGGGYLTPSGSPSPSYGRGEEPIYADTAAVHKLAASLEELGGAFERFTSGYERVLHRARPLVGDKSQSDGSWDLVEPDYNEASDAFFRGTSRAGEVVGDFAKGLRWLADSRLEANENATSIARDLSETPPTPSAPPRPPSGRH